MGHEVVVDDEVPERVLVVTAHPDDVDFGAAVGYPDGRLVPSIELRRDISRVIRDVRPARVLTQSPERNWSRIDASHPDHLAAGEATICAVYPDARNPFAHPELATEGYEAWTVPEVWLMSSVAPDRVVDITDVVDRKVAALLRHESQHTDPARLEALLRDWGTAMAALASLPEGRVAEPFQRVVTT